MNYSDNPALNEQKYLKELGYFRMCLGFVEDDVDPSRQGIIKVRIYAYGRSAGKAPGKIVPEDNIELVNCLPIFPFFGTTDSWQHEDGDSYSYGFLPGQPRKGDYVMVAFLDGKHAYYLGCIAKRNRISALPGHVGFKIEGEEGILPGTEISPQSEVKRQAVRALADAITTAGLQNDRHRGAGNQSMIRESPSMVQGWKTAGLPADNKPGHSITMDDSLEDSMIRIRTGSGNQILLCDTTSSIYVSTSGGNAWVEISEDGNIDIFSNGTVSTNAVGDINFTTKSNFNVKASNFKVFAENNIELAASGNMVTDIDGDIFVGSENFNQVTGIAKINTTEYNLNSTEQTKLSATGNYNITGNNVLIDAVSKVEIEKGQALIATAPDQATEINLEDMRIPLHEPWMVDGRVVNQAVTLEQRIIQSSTTEPDSAGAREPKRGKIIKLEDPQTPWEKPGGFLPLQESNGRINATANPYVTCWYGKIRNIGTSPHIGMDFRGRIGDKFYCPIAGIVTEIVRGGAISIHIAGGIIMRIIHVSAQGIKVGDTVKAGQIIAFSDGSGTSQPHFHVDMYAQNGKFINPYPRLLAAGCRMPPDGKIGQV